MKAVTANVQTAGRAHAVDRWDGKPDGSQLLGQSHRISSDTALPSDVKLRPVSGRDVNLEPTKQHDSDIDGSTTHRVGRSAAPTSFSRGAWRHQTHRFLHIGGSDLRRSRLPAR